MIDLSILRFYRGTETDWQDLAIAKDFAEEHDMDLEHLQRLLEKRREQMSPKLCLQGGGYTGQEKFKHRMQHRELLYRVMKIGHEINFIRGVIQQNTGVLTPVDWSKPIGWRAKPREVPNAKVTAE